MDDSAIVNILRDYIKDHILQEPGAIIEPDSPLLEWGVLNSLSTVQLIGFIREHLQIEIPPEEVVGSRFKDLHSISKLLRQLQVQ